MRMNSMRALVSWALLLQNWAVESDSTDLNHLLAMDRLVEVNFGMDQILPPKAQWKVRFRLSTWLRC